MDKSKHKIWYDSNGTAYRKARWYDDPRYILVIILICTSPLVLLFVDNYQKQLVIIEKIPSLSCDDLAYGLSKMTPGGRMYSPSGQVAFNEWSKRCVSGNK